MYTNKTFDKYHYKELQRAQCWQLVTFDIFQFQKKSVVIENVMGHSFVQIAQYYLAFRLM